MPAEDTDVLVLGSCGVLVSPQSRQAGSLAVGVVGFSPSLAEVRAQHICMWVFGFLLGLREGCMTDGLLYEMKHRRSLTEVQPW